MARIWCRRKTWTNACFGTSTRHRWLVSTLAASLKVSQVDVVKWWSNSRSKTQSAVSFSGGPVVNLARYGNGSGVVAVVAAGESARVSAEPLGEGPASGPWSPAGPGVGDGGLGLGLMGLGRLLRGNDGCGEGAEAGDGVPEPAGECACSSVERLHSMPWRRQALHDGLVSSHWEGCQRAGVRASGHSEARGGKHTLTLRCLQRKQPVRDLV
jgi:hypothetical protein